MIDFIPLFEYEYNFNITIFIMVLISIWQCHIGNILKDNIVNLNAIWGIIFTCILILYMGLRPISSVFGDTVNYAHGFYEIQNSPNPFQWIWANEWLFYNMMQWFAKNSDIHTFFCITKKMFCGTFSQWHTKADIQCTNIFLQSQIRLCATITQFLKQKLRQLLTKNYFSIIC